MFEEVPSLNHPVVTVALGDPCPREGRFAAISENSTEPVQRSGPRSQGPDAGSKRLPRRKVPSLQKCSLRGHPSRSLHSGRPLGSGGILPEASSGGRNYQLAVGGGSGEQLAPGLQATHLTRA